MFAGCFLRLECRWSPFAGIISVALEFFKRKSPVPIVIVTGRNFLALASFAQQSLGYRDFTLQLRI